MSNKKDSLGDRMIGEDELVIQRYGKWLINPDGWYPYCSECHNEPKGGEMTKFCPSCGAKMNKV